MHVSRGNSKPLRLLLCAALALGWGVASAQETKKSTVKGAGIGALLGQAIGKDTESTVIGGVIGAGVGRIVGKEKEKAAAAQPAPTAQPTPTAQTAPPAKPEPVAQAAPAPEAPQPLADTLWKLDKLQPKDRVPAFFSKVIVFRPDGALQTITTDPEGNITLCEEAYSIVGDTLVVNKPEFTIHARFLLDGDQLIISAEDFSAILKRIKPE